MWNAVKTGWTPPTDVTEDEYRALKDREPSALRGFVGFGCSFAGKWFGGYARGRDRNFASETSRSLVKAAKSLDRATISLGDYGRFSPSPEWVIYCDPPYGGLGYSVGPFDQGRFWNTAKSWASGGSLVLVSGYSAPEEFVPIAEFDHFRSVSLNSGGAKSVEKVFMMRNEDE